MASLSDFKVNTGEPVNNRTPSVPEADETDAPPEKPTLTSTTHTYHVSSNDDYAKVEKRPSQKSKCKPVYLVVLVLQFIEYDVTIHSLWFRSADLFSKIKTIFGKSFPRTFQKGFPLAFRKRGKGQF